MNKETLLEEAKKKYEQENEDIKELLKAKNITIEKAVKMYPTPSFLDFYYLAKKHKENEALDETGEYLVRLKETSKNNYKYLEEAYNDLTKEEKILFRKYFNLSYLADVYDDIEDKEDALEVISINIKDQLKKNRPIYNYTEEQVQDYFISEGFNPNKSKLLDKVGCFNNLEQLTKNINNEIVDHSKPFTFNDINEKTKEEEGLEYKYLLFCEEYLKRGKITDTCKYLGIGRATAYRWLELEDVKTYLQKRREELETEAKQRYKDLYNKCFNELETTLEDGNANDKLKAIDIFLKHYDNVKRIEAPTTDKG